MFPVVPLHAGRRRGRPDACRWLSHDESRTSASRRRSSPPSTATARPGRWPILKGKVVVLETTNHGCPYVRKHYTSKNMQDQQREAAAKGGRLADPRLVRQRRAGPRHGRSRPMIFTKSRDAAPAAVLLDPQSKVARAYGATVTPHMYIIDANGTLVYKGGIDSIPSSSVGRHPKATQYVRVAPGRGAGRQAGGRLPRRAPTAARSKYPKTST